MNQLQAKDYKTLTSGGSVFTSYPLTNYWTFGSKYRLRHSETDLKEIKTAADQLEEDNHGLISAISTSLSYDSTDNPYKAHQGMRSAFEPEFSGVGGDFYFIKLSFVNSLYIPIWEKGTLKFRGDMRFLNSFETSEQKKDRKNLNIPKKSDGKDLPLSERFFLGGETTVRGYKPFILGPKRKGENRDPWGGISSTLLSVEYAQSIIKLMDVFAFFDAGNISDKRFNISKLNCSYGAGMRLELMNRVPITIGYGKPINPDNKKDERRFFFSMGGQF
jgi:outer membrane protein insertion porin family